MPLSEEANKNRLKFIQDWNKKNVKRKIVVFNVNSESDNELLKYIESREESYSGYLKRLVREDMNK